jgi:hypothetical protein
MGLYRKAYYGYGGIDLYTVTYASISIQYQQIPHITKGQAIHVTCCEKRDHLRINMHGNKSMFIMPMSNLLSMYAIINNHRADYTTVHVHYSMHPYNKLYTKIKVQNGPWSHIIYTVNAAANFGYCMRVFPYLHHT